MVDIQIRRSSRIDAGFDTKEIKPLYSKLFSTLGCLDTPHRTIADLVTLTLLLNDAGSPTIAAAAFRVEVSLLQKHLEDTSLDKFFTVLPHPKNGIRPHHPDFLVFLAAEGQRRGFDIQHHVETSHPRIVQGCLDILNSSLRQNITQSKQTGLIQLGKLSDQERSLCPPSLQLLSKEWSSHLPHSLNTTHRDVILPSLKLFLELHLLLWIEVLVLYGSLHIAAPSLKRVEDWLMVSNIQ